MIAWIAQFARLRPFAVVSGSAGKFAMISLAIGIPSFLSLVPIKANAQIPQGYLSQFAPLAVRRTTTTDDNQRTLLRGARISLAQAANDQGEVLQEQTLRRTLLLLDRGPEQESALSGLLQAQQDPSSPLFHKWLTPEQFGTFFGPADQDVQAVTDWLRSHGFSGITVSKGRTVIQFDGNAAQIRSAFHTSIHRYNVSGAMHFANDSDPSIPSALAPVITGLVSLNDFGRNPMAIRGPTLSYDKGNGRHKVLSEVNSQFTISGASGSSYIVSPYDFATIYNLLPLWNAGLDGSGQTIAIVGQTDINPRDPTQFRAFFGLPANDPTITIAGIDPGVNEDEIEADLDVEWSGAIAKGAKIQLVSSASTETTAGVDLAALYIVDNNLAPVMSESYGSCELFLGSAGNAFESALWQQASAQGITVLVSTGDQGSSVCDRTAPALHPMAVNGLSSTPYNIAVGGTDFNQNNVWSTYWSTTNDPTTKQSVLGYIPEIPWNGTCGSDILDKAFSYDPTTACSTYFKTSLAAGSGGPSSCVSSDGSDPKTCAGGWPKPPWQSGPGVPADGVRDTPDVSFFASSGVYGSAYAVCKANESGGAGCDPSASSQTFIAVGGTSGSAPAMAGVMAIINQKYGRQGNANPALYRLAASSAASTIFHDITEDGNRVACRIDDPDCVVPDPSGIPYGRTNGHASMTGYDMATGLGSIDIANLVNSWNSVSSSPTTTSLTLDGGTATVTAVHGTPIQALASVKSTSGTPSGDLVLTSSQPNSSILIGTLSAGSATASVNSLPGGNYSVTARYGGDSQFAASESSPVSVSITPEPSTTKLSILSYDRTGQKFIAAVSPLVYGSLLLLRSDVSGQSGHGVATGSVALTDSGNAVGQLALNSEASSMYLPSTLIPAGAHSYKSSYGGDSSFNASEASNSVTIAPAPMSCDLELNTNVLRPGWILRVQLISKLYQQTVTPPLGNMAAPTGTLAVYSGSKAIVGPLVGNAHGGGVMSGGGPGTTFSLPAMSMDPVIVDPSQLSSMSAPITGVYSGDSNFVTCSSSPVQLTFDTSPLVSTIYGKLTSPQSSYAGSGINLNVQVASGAYLPVFEPDYTAPTGTVQLFIDGNKVGSPFALTSQYGSFPGAGNTNFGAASVVGPTDGLAAGMHTASMAYSGDANYVASTATVSNFFIVVPDFTLGLTPGQLTVANGQTTSASTLSVSPVNGFSGAVTFACSGLPAGATCNFSPTSISGSGSTGLTISTTQAQGIGAPVTASAAPHGGSWCRGGTAIAAGLVVLFLDLRRGRGRFGLWIIIGVILCFGLLSCGGSKGGGGSTPSSPVGTSTTLTASTSTPAKGSSVTFTAKVSSSPGVQSQPTGTINFAVDGSNSGSPVTLNNSAAQLVTSFATAGSHSVVASYSGNAAYQGSSSGEFNVSVPYTTGSIPGSYPVVITATSGTITHNVSLTLIVQ